MLAPQRLYEDKGPVAYVGKLFHTVGLSSGYFSVEFQ